MRPALTTRSGALLLLFALALLVSNARAQAPAPTPQASPTPFKSLERRFFKNILRDQRNIWLSPLSLEKDDAKWLVPLGAGVAGLIAADRHIAGSLDDAGTQVRVGEAVSKLGSFYAATGATAALYAFGRFKGNTRARETGLLAGEALANGVIVYSVLKAATQRPRPLVGDRRGRFFDGGNSFPSAHTFHAWALAAVISNQYSDKPAVRVVAYGLATAVGLARVAARKHFPSDVLVGGVLGYGIGRYVYRVNRPDLAGGGAKPSPLVPEIEPAYDRRRRAYAVRLTWGF
ncbi:MAG TPA: phosphatase PAP2 family protein [Pyrinomonadaceae bacterium]|nr:phosphatase PAP2 family protein [Pyrinomonadaceae bacterium]